MVQKDYHTAKNRLVSKPAGRRFWRLLLVVVVFSAGGYLCSHISARGPGPVTPNSTLDDTTDVSTLTPSLQCRTHRVKSGETFAGILSGLSVPYADAVEYYRRLSELGLNSIFPGDSLVVWAGPDSLVQRFSLLSRMRTWYGMQSDTTGVALYCKPVCRSSQRMVGRGILQTCLSEDMFKAGMGDALVAAFADIFAWDINFFIDPQKGDTFEVIFEKEFAGEFDSWYGNILAARYVNRGKSFWALGMPDSSGRYRYYDREGNSVQKKFLKAPLRYNRISSGYSHNRRHPVLGIVRPHLGIDYAAPRGTPVYSAADGKVTFAGRRGGYGRHIRIRHGAAYQTYYGHLHTIARGIAPGVRVTQGQLIGTVGSTGLSTGPHLDYRMKIGKRFVNPLTISIPSGKAVAETRRQHFSALSHEYLVLLRHRFGRRQGCFAVDVQIPQAVGEQQIYISRSGRSGDKSGS